MSNELGTVLYSGDTVISEMKSCPHGAYIKEGRGGRQEKNKQVNKIISDCETFYKYNEHGDVIETFGWAVLDGKVREDSLRR